MLKTGNDCIRLITIYHPPHTPTPHYLVRLATQFQHSQFSEYVDSYTTTSGKLLIYGGLNFHDTDRKNKDANKFKDVVYSMKLIQHNYYRGHIRLTGFS